MNFYCSLFDSNYLTRGLAMYFSLMNSGERFRLYVVCFDDLAFDILKRVSYDDLIPISITDFESGELLKVKSFRTKGEYCWTCTSFVIRYVLDTYNLPEVTYLDADLYFFSNPSILLEEFRDSGKSVMITEHRYTPEYDQSAKSGIYCVQFMTFKADQSGLRVLQWWQDKCLDWCFARYEDGKFGDQKYLDDWLIRFDCVHVLNHLGGGVAPWNVQQYDVGDRSKVNNINVVFFHFHNLKWLTIDTFDLGLYKIQQKVIKYIYSPYFSDLKNALKLVQEQWDESFCKGIQQEKWHWKNPFRKLKRKWKGTYNVIQG